MTHMLSPTDAVLNHCTYHDWVRLKTEHPSEIFRFGVSGSRFILLKRSDSMLRGLITRIYYVALILFKAVKTDQQSIEDLRSRTATALPWSLKHHFTGHGDTLLPRDLPEAERFQDSGVKKLATALQSLYSVLKHLIPEERFRSLWQVMLQIDDTITKQDLQLSTQKTQIAHSDGVMTALIASVRAEQARTDLVGASYARSEARNRELRASNAQLQDENEHLNNIVVEDGEILDGIGARLEGIKDTILQNCSSELAGAISDHPRKILQGILDQINSMLTQQTQLTPRSVVVSPRAPTNSPQPSTPQGSPRTTSRAVSRPPSRASSPLAASARSPTVAPASGSPRAAAAATVPASPRPRTLAQQVAQQQVTQNFVPITSAPSSAEAPPTRTSPVIPRLQMSGSTGDLSAVGAAASRADMRKSTDN